MGNILIYDYMNVHPKDVSPQIEKLEVNLITCPVVINNNVIGTYSKPFKYIKRVRSYSDPSKIEYVPNSDLFVRFGSGSNSSSANTGSYFMALIDEKDFDKIKNFSFNKNLKKLPTNFIKGKYKLNNILGLMSLTNIPSRSYDYGVYGFPINIEINNVIYTAIKIVSTISKVHAEFSPNDITFFNPLTFEYEKVALENAIIDFGNEEQIIPVDFINWLNNNGEKLYENIYTVKDVKGIEEYGIIENAPPMIKEKLSITGNSKILNLTGENDKDYQIVWTSYTPEDKIFLGLSVAPNSSAPLIPVGKEVSISFNDSTTLYEVYGKYKPLSTRFEIHTYKSSAEQNRVDKTNFLTADMIISGVLREASSLIHPSITFTSDIIPTFNYVYIPIFNRYYYVTDITSIKNKLWQMSLTVDVLMTYKEALLACNGYIDRNENEYNGLIPDGMISLQKGEVIETNFVTNELFTETEGTYILQGLLVSAGDVVTDTHTGSSGDEHSGGGGNFGN